MTRKHCEQLAYFRLNQLNYFLILWTMWLVLVPSLLWLLGSSNLKSASNECTGLYGMGLLVQPYFKLSFSCPGFLVFISSYLIFLFIYISISHFKFILDLKLQTHTYTHYVILAIMRSKVQEINWINHFLLKCFM